MVPFAPTREALKIAVLLTLLFAIAAIAVRTTIGMVEAIPGSHPESTAPVSFAILAITLAFMCIAGAVGVWAIRFSVIRESRRRVSRFVEELAVIRDGIVTLDGQGRIIGRNPALQKLAGRPVQPGESLRHLFPCLGEEDAALLLNREGIQEIERDCQGTAPRSLRFRSQPAEDMQVLFVNDITHRRAEELRREQVARFQLVGRIARGVAFDFDNLLCGIASHGALLRRLRPVSEEALRSADAIIRDAERGVSLSRHLMDLSHSGMAGHPTNRLDHFVTRATELLRIGLSSAWTVAVETESSFPPVTLSGIQVEQIILNLGLLSADTLSRPGHILITANRPSANHLLNVHAGYAAILLVSASTGSGLPPPAIPDPNEPEPGIILSVVRAMVEECGGTLQSFSHGNEQILFRVLIPAGPAPDALPAGESDLADYLTDMRLLLAARPDMLTRLAAVVGSGTHKPITAGDAVELLLKAEQETGLDAMVIEQSLISHEPDAFLRALMKLRPQAGIVLLKEGGAGDPIETRGLVALDANASPTQIACAIIEAKGLAHRPR